MGYRPKFKEDPIDESIRQGQIIDAGMKQRERLKELETQLGHIHGKIGLLAAKCGIGDNLPTDETLAKIEAHITVTTDLLTRYETAVERDVLELLQRCQSGEASCMFTAGVIGEKLKRDLAKVTAERDGLLSDLTLCNDRREELASKLRAKTETCVVLEQLLVGYLDVLKRIAADVPTGLICHNFHHDKQDQGHDYGVCPCINRFNKALDDTLSIVGAAKGGK